MKNYEKVLNAVKNYRSCEGLQWDGELEPKKKERLGSGAPDQKWEELVIREEVGVD